jgi:glycosyltransferase involved in cell wall biosynthesis
MMSGAILAYPNVFEETSCITVMEAKAAGCAIVTSSRGALPETVGEGGILVSGAPGTQEYKSSFVNAICHLFENDGHFSTMCNLNRKEALHSLGWQHRAKSLIEYFQNIWHL